MTCPPHVFRPKSFPLHGGSELFCENCGMTKTERDAALAASPPVDQGRVERLEALLVRTQKTIRDAANGEEPRFGELWRAIGAALAKDETARE